MVNDNFCLLKESEKHTRRVDEGGEATWWWDSDENSEKKLNRLHYKRLKTFFFSSIFSPIFTGCSVEEKKKRYEKSTFGVVFANQREIFVCCFLPHVNKKDFSWMSFESQSRIHITLLRAISHWASSIILHLNARKVKRDPKGLQEIFHFKCTECLRICAIDLFVSPFFVVIFHENCWALLFLIQFFRSREICSVSGCCSFVSTLINATN